METVINSEENYLRVSRDLIQQCEHPLFGENLTDVFEYERTIALLDNWRSKHPEPTCESIAYNKAMLAEKWFWELSDTQ